jgi:hypothetical protein
VGQPGRRRREYGDAVRLALEIGTDSGLAVRDDREHPPVAGFTDRGGQQLQAHHPAVEPGRRTDHLDGGVGAQRPLESSQVGILEAGNVVRKQGLGLRVVGLDNL